MDALKNPRIQKKNMRRYSSFDHFIVFSFISLIMHYLPYISIFHMPIRLLHIQILLFPLRLSAAIAASKSPIAVSTILRIIKNMHSILNSSFAGRHILYSPTAGLYVLLRMCHPESPRQTDFTLLGGCCLLDIEWPVHRTLRTNSISHV